jgi:hypothetical protein
MPAAAPRNPTAHQRAEHGEEAPLSLSMADTYRPSASINPNLASRLVRGTLTWSKVIMPLSTPSRPPLWPWSAVVTPGRSAPASSRIGTSTQCTPCSTPSTQSWPKVAADRPCSAALPM